MTRQQKRVEECENELVALDLEVVEMKLEFGRRTSEAEALKLNLKKAQDSLFAAERLLGKLGRREGPVERPSG